MEQIFLAILIIIIVKYGLFTISLKKKKGSYDFFSRSYGLSKLSMHFCALPPTLPDEHHKEVTGRILPIVCVCVCVLLGGEVKMFKNVYFRPVLELLLPTFMHINGGKQQFAHTEFHLNEALLQFRRLLATIQYSEVLYVLK